MTEQDNRDLQSVRSWFVTNSADFNEAAKKITDPMTKAGYLKMASEMKKHEKAVTDVIARNQKH